MLLAIDVGNTETVIALRLGGDEAAVPSAESASASPSRQPSAGSPTAGDSRRSPAEPPMSSPSCSPSCLPRGPRHRHLRSAAAVSSSCPRSPASCARWRHGGSPPSLRGARPGGAQRHADPLRQPERVGADRVANAVGAFELSAPVHRRDLGTATTFDAISSVGEYLGGAITPGGHQLGGALPARRRPSPCRAGRPRASRAFDRRVHPVGTLYASVPGGRPLLALHGGARHRRGRRTGGLAPSSHRSPARSSTWNPG